MGAEPCVAGPRTPAELADAAGLAPSAASPHLKLLKDVGLMHVRVDAKRRLYSVDFERLAQVRAVASMAAQRPVRCW